MKSEKKTYADRASGVEVTQLNDHKGHGHHLGSWEFQSHKFDVDLLRGYGQPRMLCRHDSAMKIRILTFGRGKVGGRKKDIPL